MTVIPPLIGDLIGLFLIYGIFSYALWRFHIGFDIVQAITLGTISGYWVATTYTTFIQPTLINPLIKNPIAGWLNIPALIIGLLCFAVFIPKYSFLYRIGFVVTIGAAFAVDFSNLAQGVIWSTIQPMITDGLRSTEGFIVLATFLIANSVFVFAKRTEFALKRFFYWGRMIFFFMFGTRVVFDLLDALPATIGFASSAVTGTGLYMGLLFVLAILIEIFIGWKQLLGMKTSEASAGSTK